MKKYFCTAICTVIFAALVITGCTGNKSADAASGKEHTQQKTQAQIADAETDGTKIPEESAAPLEGETETLREEHTGEETEGQTVINEAQTDKKGEEITEGEPQTPDGTTTTQPETKAPVKTPVQSTPKPVTPAQTEASAQTPKPGTPEQPETQAPTKTPAQSTVKPSAPAQPETQAPTKAPTQSTPKPTTPAQPETQAPTKAPETPKKEKTMWDAPYDVEAIKAYMVSELKARGYGYYPEWAEENKEVLINLRTVDAFGIERSAYESYFCIAPDNMSAWDNFCTATAGPNRYYDNINHCTVGHQHYNWSNPATGAGERKNGDGLTSLEFYVNDAINYWDEIYGYKNNHGGFSGGGFDCFTIYVEKFDDGCVIFYILA